MKAICLDIETYGAFVQDISGQPLPSQKNGKIDVVMHPARTAFWHREVSETIPLVSVTHLPEPTGNLREWLSRLQPGPTYIYLSHRNPVLPELLSADIIMGFNLLYDLSYLRARYPELQDWRPLVIDVSVLAYLEDENRIEMSLKDLGVAHGLFSYDRTLKDERFSSPEDPLSWEYAAQDTHNTALLASHLVRSILMWYGERSFKATNESLQWYSDSFWSVLHMYEAGYPIDLTRANRYLSAIEKRLAPLEEIAASYEISLSGTGSQKSQSQFVDKLVLEFPDIVNDEQLVVQTKRGGISLLNRTNLSVFGRNLPPDHPHQKLFKALDEWTYLKRGFWAKLMKRLVFSPKEEPKRISAKKPFIVDRSEVALPLHHNPPREWSRTYQQEWRSLTGPAILTPKWYLCPGRLDDSDSQTLGQKQIRPSCGSPALQTDPRKLHRICRSRWAQHGIIRAYDASQIELRVAGLWSGEESFLAEYQKPKPDLHTKRIVSMLGEDRLADLLSWRPGSGQSWRAHPGFDRFRQAGKTGNFWYVYRGGAKTMHQQFYQMVQIDLGEPFFQELERNRPDAVPGLWAWQERLIDTASLQGYIEIPWIGASRTYWGDVREEHATKVVNQTVQSSAAATILALQQHLSKTLPPRIRMILQVYDSIKFDCHKDEAPYLQELVDDAVRNNVFWSRMVEMTGNNIPLVMEPA